MAKAKRVARKTAPSTPKAENKPQELCFVIMPFGGWYDVYYENIYQAAITKAGLIPRRADDLYRPSNIVQDIWELTKKAKVIVADLTDKNPNVFYELGLAHALAKPAILITETIDDIPFDLRSLRIIEYNKNVQNWGDVLCDNIERAIKETIESPTQTIPSAFLETNRSGIKTPHLSKYERDLVELKQELELLKRQVALRSSVASEISQRTQRLFQLRDELSARDNVMEHAIQDVKNLRASGASDSQIVELLKSIRGLTSSQIGWVLNSASQA